MMRKFAIQLVDWQIRRHFLKEQDRELYEYAYELVVNQMVNILLAALIAICFKAPSTVLVFLSCYIPLRSFCGGYHEETNERCTVMSALMLVSICLAVKWIPQAITSAITFLCFMIAGVVIICLAPIEDHNKPLDETELLHYRKRGRSIWLIEITIGIVLFLLGKQGAALVIALSHITLSFMLCLGAEKNKRLKSE
ncbi:MAG: accessory gene regulator B family protein [Clostridiales bacterium]|nr:accessory gene regulator B family protein [Clostridiales bacterium]